MGCGASSPAVAANAHSARNNAKQAAVVKAPAPKVKETKQVKKEEEEEEEELMMQMGLGVPQIMVREPTVSDSIARDAD